MNTLIRLAVLSSALALAPEARAQLVPSFPPEPYTLEPASSFQEGCLSPCLCPILISETLTGTFELTRQWPTPVWYEVYALSNIDWTITNFGGLTRQVVGTGTYQWGGHLLLEHRLLLDLSIDGAPVATYDSGWTTAGVLDFPTINIAAALNGFYCYDEVWTIVATRDLYQPFCDHLANSTGLPATISATGSASIAANDLVLHAGPVPPGQPAIFYFGAAAVQVPFGDGYRCVGNASVYRLLPPIFSSAASGLALALDNTTLPPGVALFPGDTRYFQAWFRDPAAGGAGFNLSDGAAILFGP